MSSFGKIALIGIGTLAAGCDSPGLKTEIPKENMTPPAIEAVLSEQEIAAMCEEIGDRVGYEILRDSPILDNIIERAAKRIGAAARKDCLERNCVSDMGDEIFSSGI